MIQWHRKRTGSTRKGLWLKFWGLGIFLIAVFSLGAGIALPRAWASSTKPLVYVSVAPEKFFVDALSGGRVEVRVLVRPGADPHTYEPRPSQMTDMSRASAYLAIGELPFEKRLLPKLSQIAPHCRFFTLDQGVALIPASGGKLDLSLQGMDPHIWLSLRNDRVIAHNVERALSSVDPAHAAFYKAASSRLVSRIDELDQKLREKFKGCEGLHFLVFHPSLGYFARDYGLVQDAIEIEGKDPKAAQLAQVIGLAKKRGIRTLFVSPEFSRHAAQTVADEIGGRLVTIDPLKEDCLGNLAAIAEEIRRALR